MRDFTQQLIDLNACEGAIEWVNGRSLRECWQVADRLDWMIWLVEKLNIFEREQHELACDFAERVLKHIPDGEDRPRIAIETKRLWLDGKATDHELRDARDAAWGAARASVAAEAATMAARAAVLAARRAAMAAAEAAARAAAGAAERKHQCKLIRKRIPVERIEQAFAEAYDEYA